MIKYLIIPVILYYSCFLFQQLWISYDAAVYLILARSLASGNGYLDHFLSTPRLNLLNPPVYPFMLSLVIRGFGNNLLILRILSILLIALSLFILTRILAQYLKRKEIVIVFLLFALNRYAMGFVNTINAECAYFFFSWLALLIFMNNESNLSTKKLILGTLFIILAFYTRVIGISSFISLVIYLLLNKNYRQALLVLLLGLLMFPWLLTFFSKQTGYGYFLWANGAPWLWRFFSNLKYYSGKVIGDLMFFPYLSEVTFGNPFFILKVILSSLFSLLFFAGFYSSVRNRIRLLDIYTFVYFFLILFWPYHSERFLLPIFPFLLNYMLLALRKTRILLSTSIISAPLIFAIAANSNLVNSLVHRNQRCEPCFKESYSWIEANTPKEAIIMSPDPAGLYFYTQRRGTFLELNPHPVKSFIKVKEEKLNYIVLQENAAQKYITPLMEKYPRCVSLVYEGRHKCKPFIYKVE